ncbi:MAG: branched-chain amino acid ABC transporter substrate-binding protein [Actinomycetota bacterium]|nr:branched-chain amino acid ABC transporter substrate-binding protein [Actinomycetota bacterium]
MGRALALLVAAALALPATAAAQDLTIYSSLPLVGVIEPQSLDTLRGEQLALEQAGGRAGAFSIRLASLNDGTRTAGTWTPDRVAENARRAAQDPTTIAYLGEFNSGASGISIPLLNEAGILQVSPGNAYVGLTRREAAQPGEPARYYPTNQRTFGRVSQADHLQAAAVAALLQQEGAKRVFLVDDLEVYGDGLADMVRRRMKARGVRFAGRRHLRKRNAAAIARAIRRSGADAMFYGGIAENGAARLWRAVHRRNPKTALLAPEGVTDRAFARSLSRGAARRTLVTNPTLDPAAYPPAAQAFYAAFRARFGHEPQAYAIYGYEAMSVVLDAIARAGSADREAVVNAFRATRDRDSVLGRYSIDANGDTTLSTYGVFKVSRGRLVYDRTIDSAR